MIGSAFIAQGCGRDEQMANGNLAVLQTLARLGAGADVVSGGELKRALAAGIPGEKIVFSGVGKTAEEIEFALNRGIHSFNCESEAELALIDALAARQGVRARIALRVNPDVDAGTHPYISTGLRRHKFGIDISEAAEVYRRAQGFRNLLAEGVACHIGSQLLDTEPLLESVRKLLDLVERLRAQGAREADIARIHAPIGLAIGAVSPSEIAVAIMAEITAQLRLPPKEKEVAA